MANKSKVSMVQENCIVGDVVYICDNNKILESRIIDKDAFGIKTEIGFYFYEQHKRKFWFTRKIAEQALKERDSNA